MKLRVRAEWREEDGQFYEYRSRITSVVECPRCGRDVECESETEDWVEGKPGRWKHQGYGPGIGDCCGQTLVDSYDCTYILPECPE